MLADLVGLWFKECPMFAHWSPDFWAQLLCNRSKRSWHSSCWRERRCCLPGSPNIAVTQFLCTYPLRKIEGEHVPWVNMIWHLNDSTITSLHWVQIASWLARGGLNGRLNSLSRSSRAGVTPLSAISSATLDSWVSEIKGLGNNRCKSVTLCHPSAAGAPISSFTSLISWSICWKTSMS